MAMFGHNEKVIRGISFDDCKRKCDTENSFFCLSVDYTDSGTCYLSNANHLTDPEGFGAHHGATYAYVTECSQSEDSKQPSVKVIHFGAVSVFAVLLGGVSSGGSGGTVPMIAEVVVAATTTTITTITVSTTTISTLTISSR